MRRILHATLDRLLRWSGLQYLPVRVRHGIAAGAWWTLYPWSAYWRGVQEPAMHAVLLDLGALRGWSCWDLGAHFGIYAVGLARQVGPAGAVAAFEPNPISYARLERHRRMNRLKCLTTFQAAVSDQPKITQLLTYGDLRSTTTHLAYEGETLAPSSRPIAVPAVVLDELVAAGRVRPPHLVKVDVEGHAHRALAGARRTLAAHRPLLLVALHSLAESRGVVELLEPLGYRAVPIGLPLGTRPAAGQDVLFTPDLPPPPRP